MKVKERHSKGTVAIIVSNDRLQLRFNYGGKRHYLSLGLSDTQVNWKVAEAKAKLIEADIIYERLDLTLNKYRPQLAAKIDAPVTPVSTPCLPLIALWEKYTQHRSSKVTQSTLVRDYGKIAKRLQLIPKGVDNPAAVKAWLLSNYSQEVARRTLVQLNACSEWGVKAGLVLENGFDGMPNEVRKISRGENRTPFSAAERDAIIKAFEENTYSSKFALTPHSHYSSYVKLLFMTGCRPEEAVALQWKHISKDCSKIRFEEAIPSDTRIRGPLKTDIPRTFPCNPQLQALMKSIKPPDAKGSDPVLPSPTGKEIDTHNFLNRTWKPVVEGLVKAGEGEQYLPQYNARHTFITLALENGLDAKDVAYLVGNSPEVIYKHYAGVKRDLQVPEF